MTETPTPDRAEPAPTGQHGTGGPGSGRRRPSGFGSDLLTELFDSSLDPAYAAAAERRRVSGAPSPARRFVRRGGTAAVLAAFGFLIAVAYEHVVAEAPEAARVREQLASEVISSRDESRNLERRAARLREEVAAERDRALGGGAEAERLRDLEAGTGLAPVSGPGVSVTVSDGPRETDPVTGEPSGEYLGRVLDRDLQRVANALWAAGAEAVAIDGQRLSAVSTIRAAGEAILVDFTPVASPYVVEAIGPPGMRQRFEASGAAEQLRWLEDKYDMGFTVREHDELSLSAAADPRLRYARPPGPSGSPSPTRGGR